ncbi:MAG: hypothetical protein J7K64_05265, partial [Bacteroidales bacterium]|nr:hypothetical protein [Bacteroidales bacterium]
LSKSHRTMPEHQFKLTFSCLSADRSDELPNTCLPIGRRVPYVRWCERCAGGDYSVSRLFLHTGVSSFQSFYLSNLLQFSFLTVRWQDILFCNFWS